MPARIIAAQDKQISGAGDDVQIKGGNANTSGAGGSIILQPGTQASTGGDGKVIIKAASASAGNVAEIQNSSSTVVVSITNTGSIGVGVTPSEKLHVLGNIRAGNYTGGGGTYLALTGDLPGYSAGLYPTLKSDGNIYFAANGYYAAYLAPTSVGNHAFVINNSSAAAKVNLASAATSYFTGGSVAFGNTTAAGQVHVESQAAGTKAIVIRGAASQTANLQEWQNSSGTALLTADSNGSLNLLPYSSGTGNTNELRFSELAANGSHYVGLKAPDSIPSNQIWVLPSGDGSSGQVLSTNGTGTLSWVTPSLSTQVSGILPVANGGTGTSTGSITGTTSLTFKGSQADGASAVGVITDTSATYSTAGAKLLSVRNNGTEKAYIDKDGIATFNGIFGVGQPTGSFYKKVSYTSQAYDTEWFFERNAPTVVNDYIEVFAVDFIGYSKIEITISSYINAQWRTKNYLIADGKYSFGNGGIIPPLIDGVRDSDTDDYELEIFNYTGGVGSNSVGFRIRKTYGTTANGKFGIAVKMTGYLRSDNGTDYGNVTPLTGTGSSSLGWFYPRAIRCFPDLVPTGPLGNSGNGIGLTARGSDALGTGGGGTLTLRGGAAAGGGTPGAIILDGPGGSTTATADLQLFGKSRTMRFYRTLPATPGDYVELFSIWNGTMGTMRVTVLCDNGDYTFRKITKQYFINLDSENTGSGIVAPYASYWGSTSNDFELESLYTTGTSYTFRLRRTYYTKAINAVVIVELLSSDATITELSGTGTSAISLSYTRTSRALFNSISAPPNPGLSGGGLDLDIYGANASTVGGGGNVTLRGGTPATSGNGASISFRPTASTATDYTTYSDGTVNIGISNTSAGTGKYWFAQRTIPATQGDYVEVATLWDQTAAVFEVDVLVWQHGVNNCYRKYRFNNNYLSSGILQPSVDKNGAGSFELEYVYTGTPGHFTLRIRRTAATGVTWNSFIHIRALQSFRENILGSSGSGTSALGNSLLATTEISPNLIQPMAPVNNSGVGTSLTLKARDGVTTGAGGSVTVQGGNAAGTGSGGDINLLPGLVATTGTNGKVIIKPASSTTDKILDIQNSAGTTVHYADKDEFSTPGINISNNTGYIKWGSTGNGVYRGASFMGVGSYQYDMGFYIAVSNSTGPQIRSSVADGASAIGAIINHVTGLTNASAKLLSIQNNSSELISVGSSGSLNLLPYATGLGSTNEIRFYELAANGTQYVGFKAPNSIGANQIWTLPSGDGTSGQVLSTNGAGVLSWTTSGGGGTVTSVAGTGSVNGITLTGTVTSSGSLTLGGTLSGVSLSSQVTGTLPIANGGTGQATATAAFDALNPMTTLGDIIFENTGGTAARLAGNTTTTKQFLSQTGTGTVSAAPAWSTVSKSDVGLANVENTALSTWAGSANITTLGTVGTGTWNATTIGTSKGGTGLTSIGTANQVLGVNNGATGLEYKTITAGSNITVTHAANSITIAATGGGTGTVTSVGLSMPSIFTVTNSPVTTTGTLTASLNTQTANTVFAGPTTGVAAAPTFRALVAADLPTITSLGTVTTGTWNATAIGLAYGGTGATTQAGAANAVLPTQTGNSGKYLTTDGTNVSWGTVSTGVGGSGTTSYLAKFTAGTTLGNSLLADNGTQVGVGTNTSLTRRMTVASGDNGPQLAIRGWDSTQNCQVSFAAIRNDVSTAATNFAIYVHNGTSEVERFRINSSGWVGINNVNPSGQFHLNVSATGTRGMILQTIASQTVNTMEVWDSSNNVLSGITEDGCYFYGSNDNIKVNLGQLYAFEGSNNDFVRSGLWTASATATTRPSYQMVRSRGTIASSSAVQAEDYIGSLEFIPRASGAWPVTAMVAGIADGGPGTSTVPTRLSFQTGSDASSRKERLVIKNDGAVIVNPSGDAAVATKLLQIKASASHTGNLIECQNSSGTALATVDANGNITTQGSVQITSSTTNISAATNNLALSNSGFQRMNCTVACNLTGVAPPTGGSHVDGRIIRIVNVGTANLTIKHNDANSTAANRMYCVDLTDIVLTPRDMLEMMYDASNNGSGAAGWRVW